ncbi:hypothetical protein BC938DRAFT_471510 [Jimgerdemannia flammicorona]|uniref:Uncharacterized protein n=1 Tax=Jimgerdemannia flammicorona TaxID=994334 RepID=A0A433QUP7_9FUNG|nr:hypothetical protein BC938DRAFT_471510 [Jimgerdemannia flammicorona]
MQFVVYGGNNGSANDDQENGKFQREPSSLLRSPRLTPPIPPPRTRYAAATTLTTTTALPTVIPTAAGAGTSASASPSVTPDSNFNMIAFAGGMAGAVVFLALVLGAGLFYRQRRTKTTPSDSVIATQKRPFRGDQSDEVFQPFMASSGTPLQSPTAYEDTMSSPTTSSSPNGFFSFRSRKTPPARGAEPYAPTQNASFQSMTGFTFGNASPDPGPSAAAVKESFFTFLFRSITTPKRGVEPYTTGQNDNPSMSRNGTTSVVRSRTYRNADHDSVSSFTIIPPAPPNPPLHLHKQSSFVVMPQGEKYQVVPSPLSTSEPGTIVLREIEPKEEEVELRRRVQPVVKEQQWWEEAKRPPGRPSKSAGKPADKARAVEVKTGKLGRPVEEVGVGKPVGKPVEEVGVWKPIGRPVEEVEVKPVGRPVDEVGLGKPVGRPVEEVGVKKSVGRPVDEVGLRKPVVRPVYEVRAALGTTMEKSGAMDRMSAGSKMGNLADDAVIIDSMKEGYQHANFEGMEKERHQHGNFVA